MKPLKFTIPMMILIIFEVIFGIMLLVNPWRCMWLVSSFLADILWIIFIFFFFARYVIGIFIFVIGIVNFIRFMREKENDDASNFSLIIAIVAMIVGVAFILFLEDICEGIEVLFFNNAFIFIIVGIYKLCKYFKSKKAELPVSGGMILSGILTIMIGIATEKFPFSLLRLIGIAFILTTVIDVLSVIKVLRKQNEIREMVDEV